MKKFDFKTATTCLLQIHLLLLTWKFLLKHLLLGQGLFATNSNFRISESMLWSNILLCCFVNLYQFLKSDVCLNNAAYVLFAKIQERSNSGELES